MFKPLDFLFAFCTVKFPLSTDFAEGATHHPFQREHGAGVQLWGLLTEGQVQLCPYLLFLLVQTSHTDLSSAPKCAGYCPLRIPTWTLPPLPRHSQRGLHWPPLASPNFWYPVTSHNYTALLFVGILHQNTSSQGQGALYFQESRTAWLNSVHAYSPYSSHLCHHLAAAPPPSLIQAFTTKTTPQPTHSRTLQHLLTGQPHNQPCPRLPTSLLPQPYTPRADCHPGSSVHHLTSGSGVCSAWVKLRAWGTLSILHPQCAIMLRPSFTLWRCLYPICSCNW